MAKSESLIRSACADQATPYLIGGLLFRLVENQEQIATRDLVAGDLDKQAVLETLLEPSKPPRVPGTERFDYLLATPWRYPPLRYGSRFGRRFEPSLFYGGCSATTALAESAYYRWVFLFDMETHPDSLHSQHTLYQARYRSERGLRLQQPPFADYEAILTHKSDYQETQVLGSALRAVGVEAFEYKSARDPAGGTHVALSSPRALLSEHAENSQAWLCATTETEVVFSYRGQPGEIHRYAIEDFLFDGRFPKPA